MGGSGGVRLELLFEHSCELSTGQFEDLEEISERLYSVGLAVGDDTAVVEVQVAAEPTRIGQGDLRSERCGRGELGVGDEISERRFAAGGLVTRDVGCDAPDLLRGRVGGLVGDPGHEFLGARIRGDVVGYHLVERDSPVAHDVAGRPVDREIGDREDPPVRGACRTVRCLPAGSG